MCLMQEKRARRKGMLATTRKQADVVGWLQFARGWRTCKTPSTAKHHHAHTDTPDNTPTQRHHTHLVELGNEEEARVIGGLQRPRDLHEDCLVLSVLEVLVDVDDGVRLLCARGG